MASQHEINYNRVAQAIDFIRDHFKDQPDLNEVANKVHMSPAHFHRIFTEWAGTSPKKFAQYISLSYAKRLLKEDKEMTLFDATVETGLSSTSRLHDLFIKLEGMTPAEYKNGGKNLSIRYNYADSPFGKMIIASTGKGVCHMAFVEEEAQAFAALKATFPNADYDVASDELQQAALSVFRNDWDKINEVRLHVKGTGFQLKVWECLLKIPVANLSTYGRVATTIGNAAASRAVGSAIGSNPIAFLIPCHRVIQSSGAFGGYMWGSTRKAAIIGWEQAQVHRNEMIFVD